MEACEVKQRDGRIDEEGIDWERGKCYGTVTSSEDDDPHFPDRTEHATRALAICKGCPILMECRRYAIEHDIRHGVWGGLPAVEIAKRANEQEFPTPCVVCGELFDPAFTSTKYCGEDCSREASRRRKIRQGYGRLPQHFTDRRTA